MRVLKAVAHFLSVSLLSVATFVGIILLTISLTLTNREEVVSWPEQAGVYNHLNDSLLSLMSQAGEGEAAELGQSLEAGFLDQDGLTRALDGELTPQYWQSKLEGVLNPVYDWAEGTTPQPELVLSFEDKQAALARALEREIIAQLRNAPACTGQAVSNDFDILRAECLPSGVSPAEAARSFTRQLTDDESPLSKPVLTGQDVADSLEHAPTVYRQAQKAQWQIPLLLGVLFLITALTGRTLLHGLRRGGQLLFSVGLLSWLGFYLAQRIFGNFKLPTDGANQAEADIANNLANPLAQTVIGSFTSTGLWTALAVMIAGIAIWLGAFFWHKVHHGDEAKAIADRAMKKDPALPKPVKPKG
jgi:hypothetical protein